MNTNPTECPTWDEFLRPLLELAEQEPIMRRTSVPQIADRYQFSDEIRSLTLKSGQTQIHNRAGWAQSSLVKARFIEKHPTEKFTYQITQAGRDYLNSHNGPITPSDLRSVAGYEEAWRKASELKQQNSTVDWDPNSSDGEHLYAHPFNILFPNEDADDYLNYFEKAIEIIEDEYEDATNRPRGHALHA